MLSLVATVAILILLIILVFIFLKKLSDVKGHDNDNEENNEINVEQGDNINVDNRNNATSSSSERRNEDSIRTNSTSAQSSTNRTTNVNPTEIRALTKKDQQKMEKKKAKADNREYTRMLMEEKKLKEQEKERELLEREMKREDERRKEEEFIQKLKEEQEKKENAVFDQWKDQFKIAEEGEEMVDMNSEDIINDFINYIKLRKIVSLEDLSGVFKVSPNELVERLNYLESQGRISGIVDDRGKYIYITDKELTAIEKIFMQRGRISKAELIKECNKIIRFGPTDEDRKKILDEQNKAWKSFESELNKNEKADVK